MSMFVIFLLLFGHSVNGESFSGPPVHRERIFHAPVQIADDWNNEIPELSEFNHAQHQRSGVSAMLDMVCKTCMVQLDATCISQLCSQHALHVAMPSSQEDDLKHMAFATSTALQGDILCSLCKQAQDVVCTMRYCADPHRSEHAKQVDMECMQGFCRWQKERMVNTGFGNYYQGWWQPERLVLFFNEVTRELSDAYLDLFTSTSRAVNMLGK